jgi:SCF-associated factor 1
MSSPQPYVWGSSDNSRLGNASDPRYPLSVRSRRGYIDSPAQLDITDGGMTWSQNLQRDIIDACQSISGTESEKAKDMSVGGSGKSRVAVVEMLAGGWSFTARDRDGGIYVWGGSRLVCLDVCLTI